MKQTTNQRIKELESKVDFLLICAVFGGLALVIGVSCGLYDSYRITSLEQYWNNNIDFGCSIDFPYKTIIQQGTTYEQEVCCKNKNLVNQIGGFCIPIKECHNECYINKSCEDSFTELPFDIYISFNGCKSKNDSYQVQVCA